MKTIEIGHYALSDDNIQPCEGGTIIPMAGFARSKDFYLCVPSEGIYTRSANCSRYGEFKKLLFIDGSFVGACRIDKLYSIQRLYDNGLICEAEQYALGYMLWSETTLGGGKINERKEAARISHVICDEKGKAGHDERQYIRKQILSEVKVF